jgi:hypothetical protein
MVKIVDRENLDVYIKNFLTVLCMENECQKFDEAFEAMKLHYGLVNDGEASQDSSQKGKIVRHEATDVLFSHF